MTPETTDAMKALDVSWMGLPYADLPNGRDCGTLDYSWMGLPFVAANQDPVGNAGDQSYYFFIGP